MAIHFRTDSRPFERFVRKLERIENADFTPLMERWEFRLEEGNREGLLAGLDGDGRPMEPTLRQKIGPKDKHWMRQKITGKMIAVSLEGNGPPLVPRRESSRAIANVETGHGRILDVWFAVLTWVGFHTHDGRPILPMHAQPARANFGPTRRLYPKRNILKIRPVTRQRMREDLRDYLRHLSEAK